MVVLGMMSAPTTTEMQNSFDTSDAAPFNSPPGADFSYIFSAEFLARNYRENSAKIVTTENVGEVR
jgi:hypothetical protein